MKKWKSEHIVSKISDFFSEISLPFKEAKIDRVHRKGKPYKNESSRLTMKPIIIKFKSWKYRQDVY